MFAGLFSKISVYIIIALVVIGIMTGGYAYIEHLKAANETLAANVATLQTSNNAEQLQITTLKTQYAEVQKELSDAQSKINTATTQAKLAQQAIRNQNLDAAAVANSGALTIQLNDSTASTFSSWENLSK